MFPSDDEIFKLIGISADRLHELMAEAYKQVRMRGCMTQGVCTDKDCTGHGPSEVWENGRWIPRTNSHTTTSHTPPTFGTVLYSRNGKQYKVDSSGTETEIRPELKVGDYLVAKPNMMASGTKYEVTRIMGDVVELRNLLYMGYHTLAMVDIWNYYSMWPGTQDPPAEKKPARCEHKFVNVSFTGLKMHCKFCDLSEAQYKAELAHAQIRGEGFDGY